jgi:adenylosuccinate synthase
MYVDVLLGLQWGDEGKGKVVDFLADNYDFVCRFQGGPNAGHTLIIDGQKTVLHTIPSGIFRPHLVNIIGNGVVIDPITLHKEISHLHSLDVPVHERLLLANKAHLILPTHRLLDAASEAQKGHKKIGSTLRGIGPTYMDKTGRNGLRVGDTLLANFDQRYQALKEKHLGLLRLYPEVEFDLDAQESQWLESIERMRSLPVIKSEYYINQALDQGKRVLAEGAQGSMLDIDFGTYPYVTSSNTVTSGVCNGLGVPPRRIGRVIGITKAYCTRVGQGPFPTELHDDTGDRLRKAGGEFGATTGRPRRCGWLDIPQLRYTSMINGVTDLAVTKLDVLGGFRELRIATSYMYDGARSDELPYDLDAVQIEPVYETFPGWQEDIQSNEVFAKLPHEARAFLDEIESRLHVPVKYVSTGPEREALLLRDSAIEVLPQ